jgi:HEAT repeat protein
LQADLGKFDPFTARQAEQLALRLYRDADEDVEVRRRALEAVSNCSRPEVEPLIDEAYRSDDVRMRASAVFAMGRSCNEAWAGAVLEELGSDDPTIRFEAVRAAGELELEEAVPQIASHLLSDDREIAEMSIWALGEIGSNEARRLLGNMVEYAEERGDDALLELVEDALAQASLSGAGFLMDAD